jgi:phosphoribosyl-ATP pyrophosphohydrolase
MDNYKDQEQNLEHLAEEAAEVIRIKAKCLRFGLDDFHPKNGHINRVSLAYEIGHFLYIVMLLVHHKIITRADIKKGMEQKKKNLLQWYNFDRKKIQ